jgi:hypothetical protein
MPLSRFCITRPIGAPLGGAVALVGFAVAGPTAHAACGLDQCSIRDVPETSFRLEPSLQTIASNYAVEPEATALQGVLGMDARWKQGLTVGVRVPVVGAWRSGQALGGLGNTMALFEWQRPTRSTDMTIALGTQLEIPSSTNGVLGARHWMALPYARFSIQRSHFSGYAVSGWAQAFGMTRGYDAPVEGVHRHDFVVNPHADAEWVGRLDGGWVSSDGGLLVGLRADGIAERHGAAMVSAGPSLRWQTPRLRIGAALTRAVGATAREEWRLWSGVSLRGGRRSDTETRAPEMR